MSLLTEALSDNNLFAAWNKVKENAGSAGVDGVSIDQFADHLMGRLITLRSQVEQKQYQPAALLEIWIPKKNGKLRRLCIPTVRDRILQTAVALAIAKPIEQALEDASYAYRPGRSVKQAVSRIVSYREQGFLWVVDADITTFFDNISHTVLIEKLVRTIPDTSVVPLIELWLAATVQPDHQPPYLLEKGVPQGSPISPILSNLYLDDFDETIMGDHLCLVRFADDFLILCKDRSEAEHALELTESVIDGLRLKLNTEKTRITTFDQGFRFLGVDFIRNLIRPVEPASAPWVIPNVRQVMEAEQSVAGEMSEDETESSAMGAAENLTAEQVAPYDFCSHESVKRRVHAFEPSESDNDSPYSLVENTALDPLVRSLIVIGQGLTLHKDNDRLLVVRDREVLDSIPINLLDQVILHGNQMLSTALLRHAARNEIEFYFSDSTGTCQAALDTFRHNHAQLHKSQFRRDDEEDFKLMLGSAFVAGKIQNSRVLLRRYNRRREIDEFDTWQQMMSDLRGKLTSASSLNVVRGIEGQAAHLYFTALRKLIPEVWHFDGRRRRPPSDPFNALISYGYGVLFNTLMSLLHQRGLNPYLGVLHALRPGHPALVSDLMEEFRAPIVDTVALHAILGGALKPDDFVLEPGGDMPCRLADAARKKYLSMLQNKFHSQLVHPGVGQRMDYHRAIQFQIYHYARVVQGEDRVYDPFMMR